MVASVVVLPLPVGPVTTIMPCGSASSLRQLAPRRARERPSLRDVEQAAVLRQQADHGRLAVLRRHGGDADVEFGARDAQPRGAVLRQPPLGDVEAGQDLDARDQRLRQRAGAASASARSRPSTRMRTTRPVRNGSMWMSVARSSTAFSSRSLTRAHDRRAAREVAQAFDVVVGARDAARRRSASARRLVLAEPLRRARSRCPRTRRPRSSTGPPSTISAARTAAASVGSATTSREPAVGR